MDTKTLILSFEPVIGFGLIVLLPIALLVDALWLYLFVIIVNIGFATWIIMRPYLTDIQDSSKVDGKRTSISNE